MWLYWTELFLWIYFGIEINGFDFLQFFFIGIGKCTKLGNWMTWVAVFNISDLKQFYLPLELQFFPSGFNIGSTSLIGLMPE